MRTGILVADGGMTTVNRDPSRTGIGEFYNAWAGRGGCRRGSGKAGGFCLFSFAVIRLVTGQGVRKSCALPWIVEPSDTIQASLIRRFKELNGKKLRNGVRMRSCLFTAGQDVRD